MTLALQYEPELLVRRRRGGTAQSALRLNKHVHVVEPQTDRWKEYVAIRDYLRPVRGIGP